MKQLFVILISILVIAFMGFTAFASNGDSNRVDNNAATYNGRVGYDILLDDYRKLLAVTRDNVELRHEIMKKIVVLKKLSGDDSISAFIDGEEVGFDVPPVIRSNRTLIPVRTVTTALGAQVDWDSSEPNIIKITKTVVDTTGNDVPKVIMINLETEAVTINGASVELDVPPMLIENRTMVPVRFIAESFNMKIDWDHYVGAIVINR